MSTLNLYDTTIPPMIRSLKNLSAILQKAQDYTTQNSISESEFLESRLAPDMLPLPFQIQTTSNAAKFLATRVAGHAEAPMEDNEKTFAELQDRIKRTVEYLEGVKREEFDGKEGIEVIVRGYKFSGISYVNEFVLPNFFFHVTTAYAICRMKGVQLGKLDYLGELTKA